MICFMCQYGPTLSYFWSKTTDSPGNQKTGVSQSQATWTSCRCILGSTKKTPKLFLFIQSGSAAPLQSNPETCLCREVFWAILYTTMSPSMVLALNGHLRLSKPTIEWCCTQDRFQDFTAMREMCVRTCAAKTDFLGRRLSVCWSQKKTERQPIIMIERLHTKRSARHFGIRS